MKDCLFPIATVFIFILAEKVLGTGTSIWLSLIALAFCLGMLWEAGRRKHMIPSPPEKADD